ncbi:hypothetical protein BGX26_012934, partial [Mortierella sp. AD094]
MTPKHKGNGKHDDDSSAVSPNKRIRTLTLRSDRSLRATERITSISVPDPEPEPRQELQHELQKELQHEPQQEPQQQTQTQALLTLSRGATPLPLQALITSPVVEPRAEISPVSTGTSMGGPSILSSGLPLLASVATSRALQDSGEVDVDAKEINTDSDTNQRDCTRNPCPTNFQDDSGDDSDEHLINDRDNFAR